MEINFFKNNITRMAAAASIILTSSMAPTTAQPNDCDLSPAAEKYVNLLESQDILRAWLNLIAKYEATGQGKDSYYTMLGGGKFEGNQHPNVEICPSNLCSSAAGRYQYVTGTWNSTQSAMGFCDFRPLHQDLGAVYLIDRKRKVLDDVLSADVNRVDDALISLSYEWAGLPPYRYPGQSRSESIADVADDLFNVFLPQAQNKEDRVWKTLKKSGYLDQDEPEPAPDVSQLERDLVFMMPYIDYHDGMIFGGYHGGPTVTWGGRTWNQTLALDLNHEDNCEATVISPINGFVEVLEYDYAVISNSVYHIILAHTDWSIKLGQQLSIGEPIGIEGSNGKSTGCHTHIHVYDHRFTDDEVPPDTLHHTGAQAYFQAYLDENINVPAPPNKPATPPFDMSLILEDSDYLSIWQELISLSADNYEANGDSVILSGNIGLEIDASVNDYGNLSGGYVFQNIALLGDYVTISLTGIPNLENIQSILNESGEVSFYADSLNLEVNYFSPENDQTYALSPLEFITQYDDGSSVPDAQPTPAPTLEPTVIAPTLEPTEPPQVEPTQEPEPTTVPTQGPEPTAIPTEYPQPTDEAPTEVPTAEPTAIPTQEPAPLPTQIIPRYDEGIYQRLLNDSDYATIRDSMNFYANQFENNDDLSSIISGEIGISLTRDFNGDLLTGYTIEHVLDKGDSLTISLLIQGSQDAIQEELDKSGKAVFDAGKARLRVNYRDITGQTYMIPASDFVEINVPPVDAPGPEVRVSGYKFEIVSDDPKIQYNDNELDINLINGSLYVNIPGPVISLFNDDPWNLLEKNNEGYVMELPLNGSFDNGSLLIVVDSEVNFRDYLVQTVYAMINAGNDGVNLKVAESQSVVSSIYKNGTNLEVRDFMHLIIY